MPWYVIRKDFTHADSVDCAFGCGHHITSGIAFVVQDEDGNLGFSGSTCVKRAQNYTDIAYIPNFTSSTFIQNVNGGGNGGGGSAGGQHIADNCQIATTYLLLRFERLSHYAILRKANIRMLTQIYAKYQTDQKISEADINYLLTCANNVTAYRKFNLRNIMAFYNLDNLCKIIGRSKHQNLLTQDKVDKDRIAKDLYRNTHVPSADILLINKILDKIESKYRMSINAFQ